MDPDLMARLKLIKHGIPFHTALDLSPGEEFALDESWVLTFSVGFGLIDGHRYDWKTNRWLT